MIRDECLCSNNVMIVRDLDKNEVLTIKNEPKSLLKPKYYIIKDGRTVATVTKEFSPLIPKVTIEEIDWKMSGLMWREYEMLQGEQEVFSMHMESTGWGHRPCLKIAPIADPLTALGIAMTITYLFNMNENANDSTAPFYRNFYDIQIHSSYINKEQDDFCYVY